MHRIGRMRISALSRSKASTRKIDGAESACQSIFIVSDKIMNFHRAEMCTAMVHPEGDDTSCHGDFLGFEIQ